METKNKIVRTAFELFVEKGFTDVSIDQVMSEVGITKGAFYYHFKSKEELLIEVISTYLFSYLDGMLEVLRSSCGSAKDKINIFSHAVFDFQDNVNEEMNGMELDFRSFYFLLMEGVKKFAPLTERYALFHRTVREAIQEILEQGKEEGTVSEDGNSADMAFLIMSVAEGLLLQWVVNPNIDIHRQGERSFEFVWRCVGKM